MPTEPDPSPLAAIERRVQERAAGLALRMDGPDAADRLRALIDDEIAEWDLEHKRGRRPVALGDPAAVAERALRNLVGHGPLQELLEDDDVLGDHDQRPRSDLREAAQRAERLPRRRLPRRRPRRPHADPLLDDAATAHRKLDPAEGLQDAQLDTGARLHIVHGDLARGGHVLVNIRKFTGVAFRDLDELVERDMLDRAAADFLAAAVAGPGLDRLRRRARLGQDHAALLLLRRARPRACGSSPPRRCSRPTSPSPTWRPCRPDRPAPTGPRSTCAASSPGSCAWRPTSPSSARSATGRRCRCC